MYVAILITGMLALGVAAGIAYAVIDRSMARTLDVRDLELDSEDTLP